MNKYFLQFANTLKLHNDSYLALGNGFSDTWDFCKQKGDLIWVKQKYTRWISSESINFCKQNNLPFNKGHVYVSSINIMNMYQIYNWAKRYPDITFIVGGPAVCTNLFTLTEKLPNNIILTKKTVEEYFEIENFSYHWKLEPPNFESDGIAFAYTIDTQCYWGKCIFCGPHAMCVKRKRKNINFEFGEILYKKKMFIRLHSPSMSIKNIRLLKHLP
jgi:hypothetical protein